MAASEPATTDAATWDDFAKRDWLLDLRSTISDARDEWVRRGHGARTILQHVRLWLSVMEQEADSEPLDVDADTFEAIDELDRLAKKFRDRNLDTGRLRRALTERVRSWAWEDSHHPERKPT